MTDPLICVQALCIDNDSNWCVNLSKKFSHHNPILQPSCYNIALSHLHASGLIVFNPLLLKRVHYIVNVILLFQYSWCGVKVISVAFEVKLSHLQLSVLNNIVLSLISQANYIPTQCLLRASGQFFLIWYNFHVIYTLQFNLD